MEANTSPKKKNRVLPIILLVIVSTAGFFGFRSYTFNQHHVETDDAQIDANIAPVLPRTPGYITLLAVRDNQKVKAGDLLVKLDQEELKNKVAQNQAAVDNAVAAIDLAKANVQALQAQVSTAQANLATARAAIEAAEVNVRKNSKDFTRSEALLKEKSISAQAFDNALAAKESSDISVITARKQLAAAQAQAAAAQSQVAAAQKQVAVSQANAEQKSAELNLSKLQLTYSEVKAPVSGRISRRNDEHCAGG